MKKAKDPSLFDPDKYGCWLTGGPKSKAAIVRPCDPKINTVKIKFR